MRVTQISHKTGALSKRKAFYALLVKLWLLNNRWCLLRLPVNLSTRLTSAARRCSTWAMLIDLRNAQGEPGPAGAQRGLRQLRQGRAVFPAFRVENPALFPCFNCNAPTARCFVEGSSYQRHLHRQAKPANPQVRARRPKIRPKNTATNAPARSRRRRWRNHF